MAEEVTREKRGKRLVQYVPDYVVFDLETTGISTIKDHIIEISAVKVKNSIITDTFSTLVNPQRPIPYYATAVNGITDDMVADAPYIREAMTDFLKFAENNILVGHNIQSFDMKFVYNVVADLFNQEIGNDYIDTLHMARTCLPELKHHKLVDLATYFQISTVGAHRALNDCMMNQKCFEEMAKIQKNVKIQVCPKCGGEMKSRSGKYGQFYGCSNYPTCKFTRRM